MPTPTNFKLRGKRVLIADNDQSVRETGRELLGRYGCEVETTENGEKTLMMMRSYHYDVVLYDAEMSDIHLIEALEKILMKGYGYDGAHRMVKARQKGFNLALYKPFRPDLLLAELEKALTPPDAGGVGG